MCNSVNICMGLSCPMTSDPKIGAFRISQSFEGWGRIALVPFGTSITIERQECQILMTKSASNTCCENSRGKHFNLLWIWGWGPQTNRTFHSPSAPWTAMIASVFRDCLSNDCQKLGAQTIRSPHNDINPWLTLTICRTIEVFRLGQPHFGLLFLEAFQLFQLGLRHFFLVRVSLWVLRFAEVSRWKDRQRGVTNVAMRSILPVLQPLQVCKKAMEDSWCETKKAHDQWPMLTHAAALFITVDTSESGVTTYDNIRNLSVSRRCLNLELEHSNNLNPL